MLGTGFGHIANSVGGFFGGVFGKVREFFQDVKKWFQTAKKIKPIPGGIYFYQYDPKYKNTLKYYDTFPLTLLLYYTNNGFVGLNFHYLYEKERKRLLYLLSRFVRNSFGGRKLIMLNAKNLSVLSRIYWPFCKKRYLWNHIRSKVLEIPHEKWESMLEIPVVTFKKASARQVYIDYIHDLRKHQRRFI